MQQEVAEGMNNLTPQGVGHGESPTIYYCPRGSSSDCLDVACITADLIEERLPSLPCHTCGQRVVAWRYLCAPDKFSKVVDVSEA